jgi:hypothetical protein
MKEIYKWPKQLTYAFIPSPHPTFKISKRISCHSSKKKEGKMPTGCTNFLYSWEAHTATAIMMIMVLHVLHQQY